MPNNSNDPFIHELPTSIELVHQRHPAIIQMCHDKKVLHIGCVDAGLLEERYEKGELLHQKLQQVTDSVCGIDVDSEGLQFLREKGIDDLHDINIENEADLEKLAGREFDIVILSEVIEHLSNPGKALEALKTVSQSGKTLFFISVPNAFSYKVLQSLFNNTEFVHPDHNVYFSLSTIRTLLRKHSYNIEAEKLYTFASSAQLPSTLRSEMGMNGPGAAKDAYWKIARTPAQAPKLIVQMIKNAITQYLFKRSRYWAEGIIVVCRPT